MVPKTFKENLDFRREIIALGNSSEDAARDIAAMCSRDLLFYVNTFLYCYEPRPFVGARARTPPLITWEFQDQLLMDLNDCVGVRDVVMVKSRDMSATWSSLIVLQHRWQFKNYESFLVVSRTEDLVDSTEDPDSLFWKIDFMLGHQPAWLRPRFNRQKLHILNEQTHSTIDGASTTGNVGRGGRRTCVFIDEFAAFERDDGYKALAATQSVADSRIFNSTPQGNNNAYYDITHPPSEMKQIRLHWSVHPFKSKGAYQYKDGRVQILDKTYQFPPQYDYVCDGKVRSPWYDKECKRFILPFLIAQELDMDFFGSSHQFFDGGVLARIEKEFVRPPTRIGELSFDKETLEPTGFNEQTGGRLKLWILPDYKGRLPANRSYGIGVDVAFGTGASNSCLWLVDRRTGEQLGEFVDPRIDPQDLARYAIALARWASGTDADAGGAFMIWEANGPGRNFGKKVIDYGYRSIYYRCHEDSLTPKPSDVPGFWPTKSTKKSLMTDLAAALKEGELTVHSYDTISEAKQYIYTHDGNVVHAKALNQTDPSGAADNHGDRCTACALARKTLVARVQALPPEAYESKNGSLAWSREQRTKQERTNWWQSS